jgi:hypothetical protein
MSIQNLYPNIAPSLSLDFANTKALDSRVTFARASTATYYGTQTAKAEENLRTNSAFPGFAGRTALTISTGQIAPDGTSTAALFTPTAVDTVHTSGYYSVSYTEGLDYILSFFAKANGYDNIHIADGSSARFYARFDLTGLSLSGTGGPSYVDGGVIDVGNGWVRCWLKLNSSTGTSFAPTPTPYPDGTTVFSIYGGATFLGDGTSGVYMWGWQWEQRSSVTAYTPTTTQPITNYIPVLQTAAAGVARFDHNPITGESLGLLVEEQRTNLLTYSEQFDNDAWSKNGATVIANTVVSPDGTLTADKLVEGSGSVSPYVRRDFGAASGRLMCSVYARAGERSFLQFTSWADPQDFQNFNLSNGTLGSAGINTQSQFSSITSVGDGWYRCVAYIQPSGGRLISFNIVETASSGWNAAFTGNGYNGLYLWGAQSEGAFTFPTSYIPTTTAQVTRSADAASMTGANFSSWYRADEGTLYADFMRPNTNTIGQEFRVFALDSIDIDVFNAAVQFKVLSDTNVNINAGSLTANAVTKAAGAYKVNDFAASLNGATAVTDTSGTLVEATAAYIGNRPAGSRNINGTIKKLAFYPKRLANAEIVALTQN